MANKLFPPHLFTVTIEEYEDCEEEETSENLEDDTYNQTRDDSNYFLLLILVHCMNIF